MAVGVGEGPEKVMQMVQRDDNGGVTEAVDARGF